MNTSPSDLIHRGSLENIPKSMFLEIEALSRLVRDGEYNADYITGKQDTLIQVAQAIGATKEIKKEYGNGR